MPPDPAAFEPDEPELEQLMIRYQQADPAAAARLIERLSPRMYRFFASQTGDRAEADDMLQDLWLRIHRMRHTYRPNQALLPWAYAIARRVRVDSYRKRRRVSREISVGVLPERADSRLEKQRRLPPFEEMVAALPPSQREVLTLLNAHGLSIDEIARVTSSTAGAVKQRAHRGYKRLRGVLQNR